MVNNSSNRLDLYSNSREVVLGTHAVRIAAVQGQGEARFLFLHGNPSSMADFEPLAYRLQSMGKVCAFDFPGFGRSPKLAQNKAMGLDSMAEIAVAVLDELGWKTAVLIGHSHGGGVAQQIAVRNADRVDALLLLGTLSVRQHFTNWALSLPTVDTLTANVGRLLPRIPRKLREAVVRVFMKRLYQPQDVTPAEVRLETDMLTNYPHIFRTMSVVCHGHPCALLARDAHRIRARTLVIHGSQDPLIPLKNARATAEAIEGAQFVEVQSAGHMLPLYNANIIVEEMARFDARAQVSVL